MIFQNTGKSLEFKNDVIVKNSSGWREDVKDQPQSHKNNT